LLIGLLVLSMNALGANKKNPFGSGTEITGDLTGNNVKVTYSHRGKRSDCDITVPGTAATFLLRTGDENSLSNTLCNQPLTSIWNVRGKFADGKTKLYEKDTSSPAFVTATASLTSTSRTVLAHASTSVSFGALATAGITRIGKACKKDGAEAGGEGILSAYARGAVTISVNGSLGMDLSCNLWTESGGFASITDLGLLIPSGVGVAGGYSVTATNSQDPAQDFSWEVVSIDGALSGSGAATPGWVLTEDGWFLPDAAFPVGEDITYSVDDGDSLEVVAEAEAFEEGAGDVSLETTTWGCLKALFR
jgi:hypothetical protein